MAAKLAVIVVVIGAAFGALLVNRQQRIDVVAEVARAQLRMTKHRETISRLQAAVAEAVRPAELERALLDVAPRWESVEYRFEPMTAKRPSATTVAPSDAGGAPKARAAAERDRPKARANRESRR